MEIYSEELGIHTEDENESLSNKSIRESRAVSTPLDKSNKLQIDDTLLSSSMATIYRGVVARINYLSQDRSDLQYAVKEMGKDLANPTKQYIIKAKRVARYLKGTPRVVIVSTINPNLMALLFGLNQILLDVKSQGNRLQQV